MLSLSSKNRPGDVHVGNAFDNQYFTDKALSKRCLDLLHGYIDERHGGTARASARYVDPCAGSHDQGFISLLPEERTLAVELCPKLVARAAPKYAYREADWLTVKRDSLPDDFQDVKNLLVVVGNPPFSQPTHHGLGRTRNMPKEFVRKAAELGADVCGFIVPKSMFRPNLLREIQGAGMYLCEHHNLGPQNFVVRAEADGSSCIVTRSVKVDFMIWGKTAPRAALSAPFADVYDKHSRPKHVKYDSKTGAYTYKGSPGHFKFLRPTREEGGDVLVKRFGNVGDTRTGHELVKAFALRYREREAAPGAKIVEYGRSQVTDYVLKVATGRDAVQVAALIRNAVFGRMAEFREQSSRNSPSLSIPLLIALYHRHVEERTTKSRKVEAPKSE